MAGNRGLNSRADTTGRCDPKLSLLHVHGPVGPDWDEHFWGGAPPQILTEVSQNAKKKGQLELYQETAAEGGDEWGWFVMDGSEGHSMAAQVASVLLPSVSITNSIKRHVFSGMKRIVQTAAAMRLLRPSPGFLRGRGK